MLRTVAGLQQMGAAAVIGNKAAGDGAAGGRWSSLSGRGPGEPASGEHMVTRAGPRLVQGVGARTRRGAGPWQWLRTVCSWQSGRCIHCDAGPTAPGAFGTRCGLWLVGVWALSRTGVRSFDRVASCLLHCSHTSAHPGHALQKPGQMAGWAVSIFTMFSKAIWKEILIVTKKILLSSPIIHFGKIYPKETT